MPPLRCLLVDAGATLVPEVNAPRPGGDPLQAALLASREEAERAGVQHTDAMTAAVIERFGRAPEEAPAVRRQLAAAGWEGIRPFAGAAELLAFARAQGLTTVIVSNTAWHSEPDYWQRLRELGLAASVDHLVSSLDVGARKPDRRMFEAALARARCAAEECAMVGDSEANDILPARALGMRTIRVAVQYPVEGPTAADAVAETLHEVARILERWL